MNTDKKKIVSTIRKTRAPIELGASAALFKELHVSGLQAVSQICWHRMELLFSHQEGGGSDPP